MKSCYATLLAYANAIRNYLVGFHLIEHLNVESLVAILKPFPPLSIYVLMGF
jgi:hypothetical protein